ncbi:YcbK family protein [Roseospira marina]|uniref:YcbK family protein n=1 Tax=Roseospira marina TaxID=140057 RepID=UPI0017C2779A|nr:D-Ala-D-Ala carboxypeptidase family metallohydrolase [Roseospira marina]MBB4314589.1 hypothetical protein [Roseospira marina]MBB5088849.1 hypothetical protein [Roseospira marina]
MMVETPSLYSHYRDVPAGSWRWPHFSPAEIACRGTGEILVHPQALDALEALRAALGGKPLIVNSAYRSATHNKAVGGATHSKHREGTAFDIACGNVHPTVLRDAAMACGFQAAAYYPKQGFVHVDLGPPRSWGPAFPARPLVDGEDDERFAVEKTKPAPGKVSTAVGLGTSVAGGGAAILEQFDGDLAKLAVVALVLLVGGALLAAWRLGWLTERAR